jgi:hypothetical protein
VTLKGLQVPCHSLKFNRIKTAIDGVELLNKDEICLSVLALMSFEDKHAIEHLTSNYDQYSLNLSGMLSSINTMISRTYTVDQCASALITHPAYLSLLKKLMGTFSQICSDSDNLHFWKAQDTITRLLLVYKFADTFPREFILEKLTTIHNVAQLFLVSKVFFDKACQLVERYEII